MTTKPSVTVCVCTHNRDEGLANVIHAVSQLRLHPPSFPVDLLVVANSCTDETVDDVQRLEEAWPDFYRLVREPELGVNHARNRGLRAARGDLVAFLDDDCVPHRGWLEPLVEAFGPPGNRVACVGGQIRVRIDGARPRWLTPALDELYSAKTASHAFDCHTWGDFPHSGNMAVRRDVALHVGGFDPARGPVGRNAQQGGETPFCQLLRDAAWRVRMVPDSIVDHVVERERVSLSYVARRAWKNGKALAQNPDVYPPKSTARMVLRVGRRTQKAMWNLARQRDLGQFVASSAVVVADASVLWHQARPS